MSATPTTAFWTVVAGLWTWKRKNCWGRKSFCFWGFSQGSNGISKPVNTPKSVPQKSDRRGLSQLARNVVVEETRVLETGFLALYKLSIQHSFSALQ